MNNCGRAGLHIKNKSSKAADVQDLRAAIASKPRRSSLDGPENTAPIVKLKEPKRGRRG